MQEFPDLKAGVDTSLIDAVAGVLGMAVMIYDRNDNLVVCTRDFLRFFPVPQHVLEPGSRLRDQLGAVYDTGVFRPKIVPAKGGHISREDWVAERISVHWRERYESVEQLTDGRWIRLIKRRLPNGVLIGSFVDVTEQKRRDAELADMRAQAELAQHILDNLANPVIVKDSNLRFVFVNDAFCRILGFHPNNVLGRTASEVVDSDTGASFETSERAVLDTGVPYDLFETIKGADGTTMRAITRKRRSGTPGNYYVTISIDDVTAIAPTDSERFPDQFAATRLAGERADAQPSPSAHVVVVDANAWRGGRRVEALKAGGADAVALSRAEDVLPFLRAARDMGVTLTAVEVTPDMRPLLARLPGTAAEPLLSGLFAAGPLGASSMPDAGPVAPRTPTTAKASAIAAVPPSGKPLSSERPSGLEPRATAADSAPVRRAEAPVQPVPVAQPVLQGSRPAVEPRKIRVLVAEDNDVNQIVFEQILDGLNVDYRIVGNGEKAVEAWTSYEPDLILMDISMPVMNGLQASQAIREAERAGQVEDHVPIVAVTAHAMSGDRDKCFAAGMDDYLSKPVSPDKIEVLIRNWTDHDRRAALKA